MQDPPKPVPNSEHSDHGPRQALSAGLRLFRTGTPTVYRRRRLAFLVYGVLVVAMLLWPVYPRFGDAFPLVLGLPFSLAWLLGALTLMFVGLLALYLTEDHAGDQPAVTDAEER